MHLSLYIIGYGLSIKKKQPSTAFVKLENAHRIFKFDTSYSNC